VDRLEDPDVNRPMMLRRYYLVAGAGAGGVTGGAGTGGIAGFGTGASGCGAAGGAGGAGGVNAGLVIGAVGLVTGTFVVAGLEPQPTATTRSNTHSTANTFFIVVSFPNIAIPPRLPSSWNQADTSDFRFTSMGSVSKRCRTGLFLPG